MQILKTNILSPKITYCANLKKEMAQEAHNYDKNQKHTPSVYHSLPFSFLNKVSFGQNSSIKELEMYFKSQSIDIKNQDQLSEIILKSINKENFIGAGTNQSVYKLFNSGSFVLKTPKYGIEMGKFEIVNDEFPQLNIGQQVASIGNVKICRKQTGIESSIPYLEKIDPHKNHPDIYLKHLARVQKMPQKAYDDLALTFAKLNEKEKYFDYYNPNNILIDTKAKRFNLVDDLTEAMNEEEKNTIISILNPLIDIRYMSNFKEDKNVMAIWKEIITKSYIASEKANLPRPAKDTSSLHQLFIYANFNPYIKLKKQ